MPGVSELAREDELEEERNKPLFFVVDPFDPGQENPVVGVALNNRAIQLIRNGLYCLIGEYSHERITEYEELQKS